MTIRVLKHEAAYMALLGHNAVGARRNPHATTSSHSLAASFARFAPTSHSYRAGSSAAGGMLQLQRSFGNGAVEGLFVQRCGQEGCPCVADDHDVRVASDIQRQADTATAAAPAATKEPCPLTTFTASNFDGDTPRVDSQFVDSLNAVNTAAVDNAVKVHVTSSFRTSTSVPGAIVTPAQMSNHMVGHAIDMNVEYGDKYAQYCNSTCLAGTLPTAVQGFIDAVKKAGLRWGGDFSDRDPVHIDDGLNINDAKAWQDRYKLIHESCT